MLAREADFPSDFPTSKLGQRMRAAGARAAAAVHADRDSAWVGAGQAALWDVKPAAVFDKAWGGLGAYPKGFLAWAYRVLEVTNPAEVLHLCSGGLRGGFTVDIRPEMKPAYVADVRRLPFPDASFDFALADPPYSPEWNKALYGLPQSKYPPPAAIIREAARVLRPGGRVGILHYFVPQHDRRLLRLVGVWGITMSVGQRIRAFTVYERRQPEMLMEEHVNEP